MANGPNVYYYPFNPISIFDLMGTSWDSNIEEADNNTSRATIWISFTLDSSTCAALCCEQIKLRQYAQSISNNPIWNAMHPESTKWHLDVAEWYPKQNTVRSCAASMLDHPTMATFYTDNYGLAFSGGQQKFRVEAWCIRGGKAVKKVGDFRWKAKTSAISLGAVMISIGE